MGGAPTSCLRHLAASPRDRMSDFEGIVLAEAQMSGGFRKRSAGPSDHCPIRASFAIAAG